MELNDREISYMRQANRECGLSYRSSCRQSSGVETAKRLQKQCLLKLVDKGEKCQQGRYVWKTTEHGKAALEQLNNPTP